jgi:hypothetical protein
MVLLFGSGRWLASSAICTFKPRQPLSAHPLYHSDRLCDARNRLTLLIGSLPRVTSNPSNVYDLMQCGKRGFLGIGRENDGVTILRASGVGGGSLIYSNITIQPPDFVLEDPRWPLTWKPQEREKYYHLARHAIGYGVVSARTEEAAGNIPYHNPAGAPPKGAVNAGLSNIATRSARLDPKWTVAPQASGRDVKRLQTSFQLTPDAITKLSDLDGVAAAITAKLAPLGNQAFSTKEEFVIALQKLLTKEDLQVAQLRILGRAEVPANWRYWIDRARIFQGAMAQLTKDFGTVDSSINDITPEGSPLDPTLPHNYPGGPVNYCERQGRCNVGCLPAPRPANKSRSSTAKNKPCSPRGPWSTFPAITRGPG